VTSDQAADNHDPNSHVRHPAQPFLQATRPAGRDEQPDQASEAENNHKLVRWLQDLAPYVTGGPSTSSEHQAAEYRVGRFFLYISLALTFCRDRDVLRGARWIACPEDLSIIGLGNLTYSTVVGPGFTTIRWPLVEMGPVARNCKCGERDASARELKC
jgi:hypothetical protein